MYACLTLGFVTGSITINVFVEMLQIMSILSPISYLFSRKQSKPMGNVAVRVDGRSVEAIYSSVR